MKGQIPWNKGKKGVQKVSEETRRKLRLLRAGEKHPMYGKHHSEEARRKIKKARARQVFTEETRRKMSVARKGGNAGSFKKGERKSRKTEFKKGQIPHNKGKKATLAERKINSASQKKRWDRIGRQTKEEEKAKDRVYMKKKRMNPNFVKNEIVMGIIGKTQGVSKARNNR